MQGGCSVECCCGQVWTGARLPAAQVIVCAGCGRRNLIFPSQPWQGEVPTAAAPVKPMGLTRRDWVRVGLAIGITLVLLGGGVLAYLDHQRRAVPVPAPVDQGPELRQRLAQGEKWLGQGQFRRAANELEEIKAGLWLSPQELANLTQWQREAALLADLLAEPLDELVRHAAVGAEEEWQAEFDSRYRGKGVILDAEFFPGGGEWKVDFPLEEEGKVALSLKGVVLLEQVQEKKRQRLILGARLDSMRREAGGAWVIRFEGYSGAFLTHPSAAAHACPPLGEAGAVEVLRRQGGWVGVKAP